MKRIATGVKAALAALGVSAGILFTLDYGVDPVTGVREPYDTIYSVFVPAADVAAMRAAMGGALCMTFFPDSPADDAEYLACVQGNGGILSAAMSADGGTPASWYACHHRMKYSQTVAVAAMMRNDRDAGVPHAVNARIFAETHPCIGAGTCTSDFEVESVADFAAASSIVGVQLLSDLDDDS